MDGERSPIIPRQFVPVLEYAAENDPAKAAFLVKALLAAWRGAADDIDVPPGYADAWLALQGNLGSISARVKGGKKGGRPPSANTGAEGSAKETSNASRGKGSIGEINNPPPPPYGGTARVARKGTGDVGNDEFERFWDAYGKRGVRKTAATAFAKARKAKSWPGIDRICELLAVLRSSHDWTKDNGQFQPHAATWLNQERWNDELPPEAKAEAEREAKLNAPLPHYDFT